MAIVSATLQVEKLADVDSTVLEALHTVHAPPAQVHTACTGTARSHAAQRTLQRYYQQLNSFETV